MILILNSRSTGNLFLNHDDLSRFGTLKTNPADLTLHRYLFSHQRSQDPGSEMGINDEQVDDPYQKHLTMMEPRSLNPKGRNLELWKVEKLPTFRKQVLVYLAKVPISPLSHFETH
jgi:hypothetical protein